jgi:hypothetical protein
MAMAMFSSLLLLLLTPLVALSENTWNSFPIAPKSINFDKASTISFYKLIEAGALGLEDPHAVVGNSVAAGGYLLAGKAMECGDTCPTGYSASNTESFAVKTDANGKSAWTWSSKNGGKNDAANGVLELPSKDVLVVGWKQIGSVGYRYITKLAGATGVEIWTFTGFGDEAGKNGALELAVMDGSTHVVVSGLKNKPTLDEMAFKSYGNCEGGLAWIAKIPVSALEKTSAPVLSDVAWQKEFAGYMSAKSTATIPSNGNIAVLLWGEGEKACRVEMIQSDGTATVWSQDYATASKLEGTDIKVSVDESMLGISGHGGYLADGIGYSGKVVLVKATDGGTASTTEITSGGDPKLIYNECWGIVAVKDGFVVACGTGIEGCGGKTGDLGAACNAGRGDPTLPTLLFPPAVWASMAAKVGASGKIAWQRTDNHRASGEAVYTQGKSYTAPASSASEWVVKNADGSLAFVQDETMGFGIMTLAGAGGAGGTGTGGSGSPAPKDGADDSDSGSRNGPVFLFAAAVAAVYCAWW